MMRLKYFFISTLVYFAFVFSANAQTDSSAKVNDGKAILLDTIKPKKDANTTALAKKDSLIEKKHIPRKATFRSAVLPGWGQAYNHEYWKIPIVYGALAIPGTLFVYNNTWYQRTKEAYNILVTGGDTLSINQKLQGLSPQSLQYYRNTFRKDRDYSVLFFLLAWALQVADATVFAHLKDFDVSNDLSMHIQPDYNFNQKTPSLGFVFNYKQSSKKLLPDSF